VEHSGWCCSSQQCRAWHEWQLQFIGQLVVDGDGGSAPTDIGRPVVLGAPEVPAGAKVSILSSFKLPVKDGGRCRRGYQITPSGSLPIPATITLPLGGILGEVRWL
jgi:hypothetical protein